MKIAYVTPYKIDNSGVASGTVVAVKRAIEDAGNDVEVIDNLRIPKCYDFVLRILRRLFHKEVNILREPFVLKRMANEVENKLSKIEYDIVFSQTSVLCAYYKGAKPIVFYTDATFGGMLNYYWNPEKWFKFAVRHGNKVESLALKNCDKAIFASQWAADTAIKCYGTNPKKCVVINRGANIYHSLKAEDIRRYIEARNCVTTKGEYRFLFVGRNWERKGGPLALEIVVLLNNKGYRSRLVVIGCIPTVSDEDKEYVETIGFLNKSVPEENERLQKEFLQSDFYLQPSKQEAQGIAYTEASAFGVPIIATDTGGVSGVVTDRNGFLLKTGDEADKYVEKILPVLTNKEAYMSLAIEAFAFYKDALNWESVGKRLTDAIQCVVEERNRRK